MNNCEKCGYYLDGECNICGMGMSGEDTFCRLCKDNANCYYKQLSELKAENEKLKEEIKVLQYNFAEYSNNNIDTAVTLFAKDKAKLEEENALLKAYKDKYYQQTLDDEIQINELYQTLHEIKTIAETELSYDMSDNEYRHYRNYDIIRHLIYNQRRITNE